jgi:hypothetical protein
MTTTHLLLATIPERRVQVEYLLAGVAQQSFVPDQVHLVLDSAVGGNLLPTPQLPSTLAVTEYRMPTTGGPGGRWRVLPQVPPDAALLVLDDDQIFGAPNILETLIKSIANGGAAAYRGTTHSGSGVSASGELLLSMGSGMMACWVADLQDLDSTVAEIREKCGFDPFGPLGDDEAVVSTHLWRKKIPMRATGPLPVYEAQGGTQVNSQFQRRLAASRLEGRSLFWQRQKIAKVTGWPWVDRG